MIPIYATSLLQVSEELLVAGNPFGEIIFWNLPKRQRVRTEKIGSFYIMKQISERKIVCGGNLSHGVHVIDIEGVEKTKVLECKDLDGRIHDLAVVNEGKQLVGVINTQTLYMMAVEVNFVVWDLKSGEVVNKIEGPHSQMCNSLLAVSGIVMLSSGFDGEIKVWNTRKWERWGGGHVVGREPVRLVRRLSGDLLVNLLPVRMRVEVLRVRGCVGQLVEA